MNNLTKIKKNLKIIDKELSSKLLFYNEFIDINDYKIKIVDFLDDENVGFDCSNNIIYIDKSIINSISLKSQLKHELIHIYLYHITDIGLKKLTLDTSYLFILYCLSTGIKIDNISKNTIYYRNALEIKDLIESKPHLIDLLYLSLNKKKKDIVKDLNVIAEKEWFRINRSTCIFNEEYKDNIVETAKLINYIIKIIYEVDFFNYESNLHPNMLIKQNA